MTTPLDDRQKINDLLVEYREAILNREPGPFVTKIQELINDAYQDGHNDGMESCCGR